MLRTSQGFLYCRAKSLAGRGSIPFGAVKTVSRYGCVGSARGSRIPTTMHHSPGELKVCGILTVCHSRERVVQAPSTFIRSADWAIVDSIIKLADNCVNSVDQS